MNFFLDWIERIFLAGKDTVFDDIMKLLRQRIAFVLLDLEQRTVYANRIQDHELSGPVAKPVPEITIPGKADSISGPEKFTEIIGDEVTYIPDDRHDLKPDGEHILVIEDDPEFAKILYKECHNQHFKCIVAGSGETGYELAKSYPPAAIILDIKLPGIDGWKVLDLIKKDPKMRHIPVHMMSSL